MSKILDSQTKIIIWKDENFIITTPSIPHISRVDGGHLIVSPIHSVNSITMLSDNNLLKFIKLVAICEEALITVLGKHGINIPFTNNQDNGNWAIHNDKPKSLHFHIYGRAKNSIKQTFGQAIFAPDPHSTFYDNNEQLNEQDIIEIRKFIKLKTAK